MSDKKKIPNLLIHETSPYLLQHAYNPVQWYAWNEDTLKKARQENKPLIISIGYAACHWCHVMEHESFEDEEVAKVMNEKFFCIKVDREERPDVDDVYMTACQLVSQRGCGWPLNAIALPDGRPVWATTYHPKEQWIHILNQVSNTYETDAERMYIAAHDLTQGIKQHDAIYTVEKESHEQHLIHTVMMDFMSVMDWENGGRKGAPKFPMPNTLECLMKYYVFNKEERIWNIVELTLDKMAKGGIYDQLDGGFARYSVDDLWMVPHFEKMLYDNAQLLSVYSLAYRKNKSPLYEKIIKQTINFICKEWLDSNGGFYSALDADSEGEEGKYYTWTYYELKEIITDASELETFCNYYSIEEEGNFEHTNVLHIANDIMDNDKTFGIIEKYTQLLLSIRNDRVKPSLDNKILTSWNALLIKGLAQTYATFQHEEYLLLAKNCLHYLINNHADGNKLYRNNKNSRNVINGFLEDYATMIDALLTLYEIDFDEDYISLANQYAEYVIQHFETEDRVMYYYTSDEDAPLAVRKIETSDNVISASTSILTRCFYRLGIITGNEYYTSRAKTMVDSMMTYISKSRAPHFYANWCSAFIEQYCNQGELIIVGANAKEINKDLNNQFHLNLFIAGTDNESPLKIFEDKPMMDETLLYHCVEGFCKMPVSDVRDVLRDS